LADQAYALLASSRSGRAINVKELAQGMQKRTTVVGDSSDFAPLVKSALLADITRRIRAGLRPRAAYRGKDLFAALHPNLDREARDADRALADAARRIEDSTRDGLVRCLASASPAALERVGHLFLEASGWRDVAWVKRVGLSSYATGVSPLTSDKWLVGIRGGKSPVDPRGVGELRAGVKAKDLTGGLLLSPRELGPEAWVELARGGKAISLMCGEPWITALIAAGVGVVTADVRVHYIDSELLDTV
jgi:hypothetical protein